MSEEKTRRKKYDNHQWNNIIIEKFWICFLFVFFLLDFI